MKAPQLIFIESNTTGTGRIFARTARQHGYNPVVLAQVPERYGFLKQDAVEHIACETSSLPGLTHAVNDCARQAPIAGIFSSSEYFIQAAAILAKQCGLPGPNSEALQLCRNKWSQRTRLEREGFSMPEFQFVCSVEEAYAVLNWMPLPCVLKPVCGSGSFGVRLCKTPEEVNQHGRFLLQQTRNERGMPTPSEFLMEQYLVGPEFSVEAFNGTVIGITRKHVSAEPFFVELGHDFPAVLPLDLSDDITETTESALAAMQLTWGPVHVELRVTDNGPVIIEINPRLAGGFIPELVRLALGSDLIEATLMLAAGEEPVLSTQRKQFASIRFVAAKQDGLVNRISGVEEAREIPGISQAEMYVKSDDQITVHHDFRDRLGHVISCDNVASRAMDSADAAISRISIQMQTEI